MGDRIPNFRDLLVWQKAIDLTKKVYIVSKRFPTEERFGLTAQLRRAAVSVSSNIAEGRARRGNEFPHFLSVSRGSLAEVESRLILAVELEFIQRSEIELLLSLANELQRMIATLASRIRTP